MTGSGRILVVDDQELFQGALKSALQREGFEVSSASNVKEALTVIAVEDFVAVITDLNMPGGNGLEILQYVKKHRPSLPVILMTGFADLREAYEAGEKGADGFLAKPFKREELLEALRDCLRSRTDQKSEPDNQDENFCRLSIEDFVSGRNIQYGIFIRLSSTKYVKIAHQGESLPVDRIRAFKTKGLRHLYMRKEDFRKYVGFNVDLSRAVKASQLSKEKKLNFMKHTAEILLEHIRSNDLNQEIYDDAATVVETTVSIFCDDPDAFDLLSLLSSHTDFLYSHSLGVSLYSALIARELKWTSPANLFKVSMGGLMHDIGKKEIDRSILSKSRRELSAEEVKLIETHPIRGLEILSGVRSIPSDVLQIVYQHHENCVGLGYPKRLPGSKIHPMAKVVSVANEFCNLALASAHGPGIPPKEAIERLIAADAEALDPAAFAALSKAFKFVPPPRNARIRR